MSERMFKMKLKKITNVAEKLTAVKCYCESNAITSKDLETVSMIDTDFKNVWEYFKAMFSGTEIETPMAEQQPVNVSDIITNTIDEANSIEALNNHTPVKEIPKSTPVEDIPKTEPKHEEIFKKEETDEDEGEEFFQTPYEGFKVSKSGKCKVLKKNGEWVLSKPSISKGYLRVSNNGKGYQLARLMVETFIGPYKRNSVVPIYKDGNKQNCSLDNLSLDKISTKITTSQLIRACELICEFVRNHKSYTRWDLISHLAKNNSIGETCYNSIINGNYSRITEKYFIVRGGSFILNTENDAPKTEAKEETISICDEFGFTKDSEKVREWIRKRLEKNERKFSPVEKVTIVLSYINDGLKNPEEIRKKMYADFGEIFIPISFIMSVLGKKICPELCNKIF